MSLRGFGLPIASTLYRPELDQWAPGEHNGTFRGHNPAFITATKALDYWKDDKLSAEVERKAGVMTERLTGLAERAPVAASHRGRGLIQGIAFEDTELAGKISAECFKDRKSVVVGKGRKT